MVTYKKIHQELKLYADKQKATFLPRFFKTGIGEYGEHDFFLGVVVPNQRIVAKKYYAQISADVLLALLQSKWHEERLTALIMLVSIFNDAYKKNNAQIWVQFYIDNIQYVNNWDLVDSSASLILGKWLLNKDKDILYEFANTNHLWKNRIAIISCHYFIKQGDLADLMLIAKILLNHPHDLIHKAVGWMLREGWKKNPIEIDAFLINHYNQLNRTLLRYAIEKMPEQKRKTFLNYNKN